MTLEEYISYLVFNLLTEFYQRALKIQATTNFAINTLNITKPGKNLYLYFHRLDGKILNIDTLGYLDIYGTVNYQWYLTSKFEWVVILNNERVAKVDKGLIDFIFYKVFGTIV